MSNRTIKEVSLLDLLPENLKQDHDMIAASKAVDLEFFAVANEVENVIILPRVDKVSEEVLDHLAYFFHVDFYDMTLDVTTKRKLINDSIYIHQIKGTPAAVEKLIDTLFNDGYVTEWFEYGDTPYRFRVVTANESVTNEKASQFIRALNSVKNKRSVLDSVIILQSEKMNMYWGGFVQEGSHEVYRQVIS